MLIQRVFPEKLTLILGKGNIGERALFLVTLQAKRDRISVPTSYCHAKRHFDFLEDVWILRKLCDVFLQKNIKI